VLEIYPAVPRFLTVEVSWAEEIYPAVPRFRTVEYSWSPVTPAAYVLVYICPRPSTVDMSWSCVRPELGPGFTPPPPEPPVDQNVPPLPSV